MTPPLHLLDTVALLADHREHGLVRGQVGTVVERLDDRMVKVEFCDDDGRSYAQLAVAVGDLLRLRFCRGSRLRGFSPRLPCHEAVHSYDG